MIIQQLKKAARQYAAVVGVRKTTVDQLASAASISKGAFYKFYPSKELLFFELLEEFHTEVYEEAERAFLAHNGLSTEEQVTQAILAACHTMEHAGMMEFVERDVPYLLRKIPEEIREAHYHSDEVHIRALLERAGLTPLGGAELAAAVVRGLFLILPHRENIGTQYPAVLEIMVRGACHQLFS